MAQEIRFGDFVRENYVHYNEISYNKLSSGSKPTEKLQLRTLDVYRLLTPYLSVRFIDQIRAVVPLALYLILFQILILRQHVSDSWIIIGGLFSVILGLMLFMEGLKIGLMPFGESIGNNLPRKSPLPVVLFIVLLLGIGVTFAEPAIGALKAAGSIVDAEKAPYLYIMLNKYADILVMVVGIGVGLAAVVGTLRFIHGWSLKPLIYLTLLPVIGVTSYIMLSKDLSVILGLAWDCGAVTTGPVTVPLVLSLGIGVAAAAGKGDSSLSGFGIVTLASLFPILVVLLLGLYVSGIESPESIKAFAHSLAGASIQSESSWFESTPGQEIVLGIRAIVPLIIFLLLIMKVVLRERVRHAGIVLYGIVLCVLGMIVFNLGLTYGLAKLGNQMGGLVPAAFKLIDGVEGSPLYGIMAGISITFLFAWFLGFGATLAEPALNALGMTVENLTNGAFKKSLLMYSVSVGVATGIALGICKMTFDIPLQYLLLPGYFIALGLTVFSTEEFVNVAWDSAGVTTGPVTVPLVLAMGLGFGKALNAADGFGILSLASICPIISVLTVGIYIQYRARIQETKQLEARVAELETQVTLQS